MMKFQTKFSKFAFKKARKQLLQTGSKTQEGEFYRHC